MRFDYVTTITINITCLSYWRCGDNVIIFVKGAAADATDAPQPWGLLCNPVMKMVRVVPMYQNINDVTFLTIIANLYLYKHSS
jgi:hypothetical protein